MKKLLFLFIALLMSVTIASAKTHSYGPVTLQYDTSTETNMRGVTDVIVLWDKKDAKGINVVGTVKVGDQEKPFSVQGSKGQCIITFRNLEPEKHYYIEWDFIEPVGFPNR